MKRRGFLKGVAAAIAFLSAAASGLAKVCAKVVPVKRRIILPPVPKWNPGVDGIDQGDYMRRAEDFERAFLPKNLMFPREGEVWEVVRDCEISDRAVWNKDRRAFTFAKVQLSKGERVRILPLDHPKPLRIRFQRLQPEKKSPELCMRTAPTVPCQPEMTGYFNQLFRLAKS